MINKCIIELGLYRANGMLQKRSQACLASDLNLLKHAYIPRIALSNEKILGQ